MDVFDKSVQSIKGIGPQKAKLLGKLGIATLEDILYYFPRSYRDKSQVTPVAKLIPEETQMSRVRISSRGQEVKSKRGLTMVKFSALDDTGKLTLIWYNNRFIKNALKAGDEVMVYGKVKYYGSEKVMESPEYEKATDEESIHLMRIVPDYPLTEGLYQKDVRKAVYSALESTGNKLIDMFPEPFRKKYQLSEVNFCIRNIHFPETMYNLQMARQRFKFEELFMLQSGLIHIKHMNEENNAGIPFDKDVNLEGFIRKMPFKLTNAQQRTIDEVAKGMESPHVMNRLVQGDVGSGKTAIAMLALFKCVRNGYQGVMMAPTEILAEQHLASFRHLMEPEGIRVDILKGGMTAKEKRLTLERAAKGEIDILIGTHALLEDKVEFAKLGLVVTDEQHRFGVRQRTILAAKGQNPDILVMTATPIPRTLSLILYGDLDISIIDELPPGRKKIETYYIDSGKKERLFNFIKKELDAGRQAYVVCPLVEESEKLDLNSAVSYSQSLQEEYFNNYKVALLHGKMKADEKKKIMDKFRCGETQILVSTTVIEVGVNIPNASIMVIENADRFGMAQLHQLRGRVGRGEYQSYCILISDSRTDVAVERLKFMTKTENGFEIAEKDMELRGSGEMLGQRQHGLPELKLADLLEDVDLVKLTRDAVSDLYESGQIEDPVYNNMKKILDKRFNKLLSEVTLN